MNSPRDLRTRGIVLRRTNYAEADRILNLITPEGKISAIAKGVRREKSKLAGGIEMFSLIDFNIHQGKGELGIITGAKMLNYYAGILGSLEKTELAAMILKKVAAGAENSDSPDFFEIAKQSLEGIHLGFDLKMVECWFLFNFKKAIGEEVNLYRDTKGEKLAAEKKYEWDNLEAALSEKENGAIAADEIKLMRLILVNKLAMINKIKGVQEKIPELLKIAYAISY